MNAIQKPYTVQQITREIQQHLEESYDWVQVQGELSGFKKAASGHAYFALKDSDAVLNCVAWKSTVIRWSGLDLKDGMEVIVGGNVTLYPARGQVQMVVSALRLAGVGTLQLRFERLKRQLMDEGLFDPDRKQPLPAYPKRIALLTSPMGAAVHDFLKTLRLYSTPVEVTVCPVPVQGDTAAPAIVNMLNSVDASGQFDLIVLCRGGGSLEDLWAFNEELVARAIAAASTPVLTGIGHEVDSSIADGVADAHASTPTAAATAIASIWSDHRKRLHSLEDRLLRCVAPRMKHERNRLTLMQRAIRRIHPRSFLTRHRMHLDDLILRLRQRMDQRLSRERAFMRTRQVALATALRHQLTGQRNRLQRVQALLHSYDPAHTLSRGYAICRDESGNPLQSVTEARPQDRIQVQLKDGRMHTTIQDIEQTNEEKEDRV